VSNIHRPNFRASSTGSTDGCQLRFAQVIRCSHECICADSVSTGHGKVTIEADFDCTNTTTGVSNCASGAPNLRPFLLQRWMISFRFRSVEPEHLQRNGDG
jgi:hypothetical protein